ncbi:MAG: hypothetical protein ACR2FG_03630 [Marmoricola sp.]
MADKVILHVGVPKTGTSFVQDRLFNNPESLAAQGISYPADRHDAQFLAALDLMRLTWGGLEKQAAGAWERLASAVREAPGAAIVSHEIFGFASRAHVARALEAFGDVETHVVLSARDLVRQIPAEWQENVKHRRTVTYAEFLEQVRDPARNTTIGSWFWGVQEVPDILDRWGGTLPPERVHVVTVPHPGAARDLLWRRLTDVFGIDPGSLPVSTDRDNPSLGVPETSLVLRLNTRINNVVGNERYRQFVRELLVHKTLSRGQTSPRLSVPPEDYAWAAALCGSWVAEIAKRGYDVVGDLEDLLPAACLPWVDPDRPDEADVAAAGLKGLAAMVGEAARLRDVEIELHAVIKELERALAEARDTPSYRLKEKLVDKADSNLVARVGLGAYRALRGRNSRET